MMRAFVFALVSSFHHLFFSFVFVISRADDAKQRRLATQSAPRRAREADAEQTVAKWPDKLLDEDDDGKSR